MKCKEQFNGMAFGNYLWPAILKSVFIKNDKMILLIFVGHMSNFWATDTPVSDF